MPDIIKITSDRHLLGAHPGHHNGLDPVFALAAIHLLQIDLVFPQEIIPVLMRVTSDSPSQATVVRSACCAFGQTDRQVQR